MILRRLARSLRQQNWSAIWIEFVLLVVGVFLGIQVSNWNTARAEQRLGRAYAQQLARDLRADHEAFGALAAYHAVVLQSVLKTDALLRADDPDPRSLVINAYRATEVRPMALERATWDQMVSAGHLDLLPSGLADGALASYYGFDTPRDVYARELASPYRRTVRRIIPIAMQVTIQAGCSDSSTGVGFVATCNFDAAPDEIEAVARALRSNPVVLEDLREQYTTVANAVSSLAYIRDASPEAIRLLEAYTTPARDGPR